MEITEEAEKYIRNLASPLFPHSKWVFIMQVQKIYEILTVAGVDDNSNPIEATERVDFLPK